MIRLYILEDEATAKTALVQCLERFAAEHATTLDIKWFYNAYDLLENYEVGSDLIFFDIEMVGMNGMEAAKKIRQKDSGVLIVFVTNLAQYAIEGYEVNAFDFILKPINYESFSLKFERIFNEISHRNLDADVILAVKGGNVAVKLNSILYIEVRNHNLIYHLENETYSVRGTLKKACEEFEPLHFALCNACYLVNLKHVKSVHGNTLTVGGEELSISQGKRKEFVAAMAQYFGGSV